MDAPELSRRRGGTLRRIVLGPPLRSMLSLAVIVVIFAGVLPRLTDYDEAWHLVAGLSRPELALVLVVAAVNVVSYAPLWVAALPGLSLWRGAVVDQVSTALTNTVPAGFAFGAGADAVMFHSFGFTAGQVTRAIALTSIWNNLGKLAMPAVALLAVAMTGAATTTLAVAAGVGAVVLLLAVGVLVAVLAHPQAAALLSGLAERLARRASRPLHTPAPAGSPSPGC